MKETFRQTMAKTGAKTTIPIEELVKLREQNRRLKAAIARARKCQRYDLNTAGKLEAIYYGELFSRVDVLAALRLQK